ncbi:MAG: phosphosulfolactate synthase [Alphaproteobacteria bacterium]|nr:phosphosulfolactate synthase [Alphaproteobacteria bacterium]
MELPDSPLAFSDVLPMVEPRPKPRNVGLTEVRTPAHSLARISSYVEVLAPYLDSVKWTCGTQRLLPRSTVREINDYLHSKQIEVSSGGLIETVMPLGEKAVRRYLEQSKELGFDIIEISSAFVGISLEDKCNLVRAVRELGLKPKPEVNAYSPGDRRHISSEKVIREASAVLEAGAWKIMIEEDGIFSVGNDGADPKSWNRDLAWRLANRIPQEYLYWEASDNRICMWLLNSFGPDINLFGGDEQLGYIAAFRAGVFATNIAAFRG